MLDSKHGEIVIEAGVDRNGNGSMGVNVAPHSTLGRRKAAEIGVTDAGDGYFSAFSGDGRTLMYAGASASGNGMLEIMSDAGERLIYAGASNSGDGFLLEGFNKTGDAVVQMYADDYGHGVVGAYDRKGQGRTLKPGP